MSRCRRCKPRDRPGFPQAKATRSSGLWGIVSWCCTGSRAQLPSNKWGGSFDSVELLLDRLLRSWAHHQRRRREGRMRQWWGCWGTEFYWSTWRSCRSWLPRIPGSWECQEKKRVRRESSWPSSRRQTNPDRRQRGLLSWNYQRKRDWSSGETCRGLSRSWEEAQGDRPRSFSWWSCASFRRIRCLDDSQVMTRLRREAYLKNQWCQALWWRCVVYSNPK